jgi:UrcA family protein
MSRTIKILLAVCALAALTPAAYAEPIVNQVRVAYGDLNLDDENDARELLTRLEQAARRACGGKPFFDRHYNIASQEIRARFEVCYASALDNAVARFDAPHLHLARAYARSRRAGPTVIAGR